MADETVVVAQQEVESKSLVLYEQAKGILIRDQVSFEQAGEMLKAVVQMRKQINDLCDPAITAAHEAHKAAINVKKKLESPVVMAEDVLRRGTGAYISEQERLRKVEEARLAEEARKKEEELRKAQAKAAKAEGLPAKVVEAIKNRPIEMPKPVAAPTITPVAGLAGRTTYEAEVESLELLLRAVVQGKVQLQAIQANMVFLNQMAKAMKDQFSYPGVKLVKKSGVSVRA